MWMVTGAAGFIGSCFTRRQAAQGHKLCLVDKLTYAGNLSSIDQPLRTAGVSFSQLDIGDQSAMLDLLQRHACTAIVNFAAESHVDRSIDAPSVFAESNVLGTVSLLSAALVYWRELDADAQRKFRFLHVSTDEVYGSLGTTGIVDESSGYAPNSPYAASKAASDHFVRAFHRTYGLPVLTTCGSNTYGAYQFPEKLIPLMILNATEQRPLPVYGDGLQVRDWLHVDDHCSAIERVLESGRVGEVVNIGGASELTNLHVVQAICDCVAETTGRDPVAVRRLITHVTDRPGHDRRYAMDTTKLRTELNWSPTIQFADGLRSTVQWYLDNEAWVAEFRSVAFRRVGLG